MGGLNGAGDYHGYEAILALKARLKNECGKSPRIEDLLALDDKNDPFYAGAPAQRARAEWFAQVWHGFGRARTHLRAVHYWLVTQPDSRRHDGSPYENTVKHWKYLDECSKYARYLGLVDAEAIEDHRNPEPEIYAELPLFTEEPRVILESLDKWSLPAIESDLAGMIELPLPGIADVEGYEYRPIDEPYFIELWIEKSTMDYLLRPICRALHVNFVPSVGFQSIGSAVKLLKRVQALGRVCQSGKPVRIFHIADFDPAGSHMAAAIARQVEFWLHRYAPEADIKLTSLALTHDQVVTYRLPRKMLQESDTRKRGLKSASARARVSSTPWKPCGLASSAGWCGRPSHPTGTRLYAIGCTTQPMKPRSWLKRPGTSVSHPSGRSATPSSGTSGDLSRTIRRTSSV